jgi:hypothetical protein
VERVRLDSCQVRGWLATGCGIKGGRKTRPVSFGALIDSLSFYRDKIREAR